MRSRLRRVLIGIILLLYVASIPWYRPTGAVPEVIFGLPDWVATALACYTAVAILNSVAWLLTDVRDAPGSDHPEDGA